MSVTFVCAKCGDTAVIDRLPVEACPRCGTPYPLQERLAAELALRAAGTPKPGLLAFGQLISSMIGGLLLGLLALAAFGVGNLTLFGDSVTGIDFLRRAGPLLGGLGIILSGIGIGLARDTWWSRPLMLVFWMLPILEGATRIVTGTLERKLWFGFFLVALIGLPLAILYLYRRDNVVAYFAGKPRTTTW